MKIIAFFSSILCGVDSSPRFLKQTINGSCFLGPLHTKCISYTQRTCVPNSINLMSISSYVMIWHSCSLCPISPPRTPFQIHVYIVLNKRYVPQKQMAQRIWEPETDHAKSISTMAKRKSYTDKLTLSCPLLVFPKLPCLEVLSRLKLS